MSGTNGLDGANADAAATDADGDGYALDAVTDDDRAQADPRNLTKMERFVESFARKSGSYLHPQREITEFLVIGLAKHVDDLGRPLCPCNFYEDKQAAVDEKTWICACEEMQRFKYCH